MFSLLCEYFQIILRDSYKPDISNLFAWIVSQLLDQNNPEIIYH